MKTNTNFTLAKLGTVILMAICVLSSSNIMANNSDESEWSSENYLSSVRDDNKSINFNTYTEIFLEEALEEEYEMEEWMLHIQANYELNEVEEEEYEIEPWMSQVPEYIASENEEHEIEEWMYNPSEW